MTEKDDPPARSNDGGRAIVPQTPRPLGFNSALLQVAQVKTATWVETETEKMLAAVKRRSDAEAAAIDADIELRETRIEAQTWSANEPTVRARIQAEYDGQAVKTEMDRLQFEDDLDALKHRLAVAKENRRREQERIERENERRAQPGRDPGAEDERRRAEFQRELDEATTGAAGWYMREFLRWKEGFIAKKGGEASLTDDDREEIARAHNRALDLQEQADRKR